MLIYESQKREKFSDLFINILVCCQLQSFKKFSYHIIFDTILHTH